jgi:hypothetical protein
MGAAFADDEILQCAMDTFSGISREELEAVFEEWPLRLDRCVQQNGEYAESEGSLINIFSLSQLYPVSPC